MKNLEMEDALNVFGQALLPCNEDNMTGFFRDGCCNTHKLDSGSHTICAEMTQPFLEYSRFQGNDLSSPRPEFNFPGLKPGDCWCLCASRWLEAYHQAMAPKVHLKRTHLKALDIVSLKILSEFAVEKI